MPPIYHAHDKAGPSHSAQQPPPGQTYSQRLNSGDICVGCILWLPPKNSSLPSIRCTKESCCGKGELYVEGYNHPVVVLRIRQRQGSSAVGDLICTVACITTFSDESLKDYLSKSWHRKTSIPIFDPEATPLAPYQLTSLNQLKLEEGRLKKQSYVRIQHTYQVPASILGQYAHCNSPAYKRRLSNKSYYALMALIILSPEKFEVTATLSETKKQRLSDLASSGTPPKPPPPPSGHSPKPLPPPPPPPPTPPPTPGPPPKPPPLLPRPKPPPGLHPKPPPVVRARQTTHPAMMASQPVGRGSYNNLPAALRVAQDIPPSQIHPPLYNTQPNYPSDDSGGGNRPLFSFFSFLVVGLAILALVWWKLRDPLV